jgi:hypothetical protein
MIHTIDLTRLRSADFIQFSKDFTIIVNRNNPSTLLVQPQHDALLGKITEMEKLFKAVTSNPITAALEALDLRRDRALNGLTGMIRNFTNHFNPEMAQAASLLQTNLDQYGSGIATENYQRETAIINSLITDWKTKPELQKAINLLGLSNWVSELEVANDEFGVKYIDRTQDYGAASPENLKDKRAEAATVYYALRKRLEARAEIEGTPLYGTTISELNALITQYNTLLKGRTTTTEEVKTN